MKRHTKPTGEEMAISALFFIALAVGWILLGIDFAVGYLSGAIIMFAQGRAVFKEFLKSNFKYGGQK